jgi:uncharacterized lipoprotein YmbA
MRLSVSSGDLTSLLTVVAIIFCGCVRSPAPRYYALSSIQEGQDLSSRRSPVKGAVIGIGPVKLADYLDQSQIVTRTSNNQVVKAEFDRWAGPFKDNFINVLADDIGLLLSTERIYLYPWRNSVPIDYQVTVEVVRCDGRLGDAATLETRWSVFKGPEKKLLKAGRSSIMEPVTGADYSDLVAAQSRAVAKFSQQVAAVIKQAGKD